MREVSQRMKIVQGSNSHFFPSNINDTTSDGLMWRENEL